MRKATKYESKINQNYFKYMKISKILNFFLLNNLKKIICTFI